MNHVTKRLRGLTIIPESLYVRRAADEQLKAVVENMGRPGYVLVARQMGKTNLLLNAKRELSIDEDVFLYVDLSNTYPTLHQFFRNIIDTAIEAHPEFFGTVSGTIVEGRLKNHTLPAHKEHEQELRKLLGAVQGKIVICLDEIDALTNSPYSDSVFSLIRSTYFASRINFSEFNRLTYILSGVAEPTEIIKNKDISPFNIGEKIYLDDFTYEEYLSFLGKAQLAFSNDVTQRIFYWTNGNPRMCWDLCAALEDAVLSNVTIGLDEVDRTVRKLYLTSYDLAPVDHIRQLAEDDKEIRNAIMNIHYGKFSSVGDGQRTKLYLAGIVKANFLSGDLAIKNKIIEESLSEEWLNSVESSKLSLLERADKKLAERSYDTALALYRSYEDSAPSTDRVILYHNMGECCIRLGDYAGALDYLRRAPAKKSTFAAMFFRQHLWLGIAQFRLGDIDGSIQRLDAIITSDFAEGYPPEYFEALINRSAPYFERFSEFGEKIIADCRQVIDLLKEDKSIASELSNTLRCAAYLNTAVALERLQRHSEAAMILREGIASARVSWKPALIVQLVDVAPPTEREQLLREACDLIGSEDISFNEDVLHEQFNFSERVYADLLVRSLEIDDLIVWKELIQHLRSHRFGAVAAKDVLQAALLIAVKRDQRTVVKHIFRALLSLPEDQVELEELKTLFFYVLHIDRSGDVEDIECEFVARFGGWGVETLTERDLLVVYVLVEKYIRAKRFSQAVQLVNSAQSKRRGLVDPTRQTMLAPGFISINFLGLILLAQKGDWSMVEAAAREIEAEFAVDIPRSSFFAEDFFENIKEELNRIVASSSKPVQVRNERKRGRNDFVRCRYEDGTVREGKFKTFNSDISSGKCLLIE